MIDSRIIFLSSARAAPHARTSFSTRSGFARAVASDAKDEDDVRRWMAEAGREDEDDVDPAAELVEARQPDLLRFDKDCSDVLTILIASLARSAGDSADTGAASAAAGLLADLTPARDVGAVAAAFEAFGTRLSDDDNAT